MSEHIETRKKIQNIHDSETFENLLNRSMLSTEDKEMMRLHYVEDKDFRYIGDLLGYSESRMKQRHRNALKILKSLL